MRNLSSIIIALAAATLFPVLVFAHGSNIYESEHSHSPAATHEKHEFGSSGDEFEELHEQIEELHEQLKAHDEHVRLTDVIGGIGYIVGITGIAYYYLGGRRKKALSQDR